MPDPKTSLSETMHPLAQQLAERASQVNRFARAHRGRSLLVAIAFGLLAGFLVRAWSPRPPRNRAVQLFADLHEELHEFAAPLHRQADHLLASGAAAAANGTAQLRELHLDRGFARLVRRCQNFFH